MSCAMHWVQRFTSLEFDDYLTANHQVDARIADRFQFVGYRYDDLPPKGNLPQIELMTHRLFIVLFREARPKLAVDVDARPDDGFRQPIQFRLNRILTMAKVMFLHL